MLLRALYKQRFGIQKEYTEKKLDQNINSPKTRAKAVRNSCDFLTLAAMLLAGLTGILLLASHQLDSLAVRLSMGLARSGKRDGPGAANRR